MAAAADADALDALLSIQLKLVEQQIRGLLAQPKVAPAPAVNSVVRDDGLARTVAAKQTRLRALDAQNAALERELAASAAALRRGPGGSHVRQHDRAMPRPSSDDVELREMLRESVQMHRELMQDVRAATEGRRQQRQRWDEEDGDGEDSDTDTGWPKELDDVPNANADPYGSFGGTLAAHPPPMQAGPQPSAEPGVGGANGEPGWGKAKGKGAASELQEELLSEIDHVLEENAVSSDSDAPSEEPLARRGATDPGGPSQDDPLVLPRTAGSGSSVVTGEEEEEEEEEPAPSDEDVRLALESLYESAGGWLKRAMRPIVSSIVRDPTLKLDVWGNEAIGGGLLGRVLGSRPGVPKPFGRRSTPQYHHSFGCPPQHPPGVFKFQLNSRQLCWSGQELIHCRSHRCFQLSTRTRLAPLSAVEFTSVGSSQSWRGAIVAPPRARGVFFLP